MTSIRQADATCDARGQQCPMPLLYAKKALNPLHDGQVLHLLATDHSALADFQSFCKQTGHVLLDTIHEAEIIHFFLEKRTK